MDKNEDGSDQPGDGELMLGPDRLWSASQSRKWTGLMRLFQAGASVILPPSRARARVTDHSASVSGPCQCLAEYLP